MADMLRRRFYLATIADDAPEVARESGLGIELDEFCMASNMDADFERWDALARSHADGIERRILHAPFAELSPCAIDPMVRTVALRRFEQAAALCRRYGAQRMVVHSGFIPNVYFPEWFVEQGAQFFREFLQTQPADFRIMIENVLDPEPGPLSELVARIDDPRAGVCLDVGHAHVSLHVPASEWLRVLGPQITHLHVHDNDRSFDQHCLPGDGSIGFPAIWPDILALDATVTLECRDAAGCILRLREHGILP